MVACEVQGSCNSKDISHTLLDCDSVIMKVAQYVALKHRYPPTILYGISTQKISVYIGSMHSIYFLGFVTDLILFFCQVVQEIK